MKKYELTTETLQFAGRTLHRIKALRDFGSVKAGELGGWIEKEENLSQDDNAWIRDNAKVYEYAKVYGEAVICGNAIVFGNARVFDSARVYYSARVYGDAIVYNNAIVDGNAIVSGNAMVSGNAEVCENAKVCDNAEVYDLTRIFGNAKIFGNATIKGDAKVHDAVDYIVFKNFWSSERYFTWTRSNNKWSVGCFHGTGEELIKKAYADSNTSGREYERVVRYVESILADEKKEKVTKKVIKIDFSKYND